MAEFRNLNELIAVFANPTTIAINYVTDKIIEELQMQMADMKIGLNSNSFYTPTGEFYDAWRAEIATRIGADFQSVVYFASETLTNDPDNFIHGSNYYDDSDVRDMMPYIIFGGHSGGMFGEGFWTQPRPAFDKMLKRANRSFNKWLFEGYAKAGITLTKDNILSYLIADIDF